MSNIQQTLSPMFAAKAQEIIKEVIHKMNQLPKDILHSNVSNLLGYESTVFTEDAMKTGRCSNPKKVYDFLLQILEKDLTQIAKSSSKSDMPLSQLQTQVSILARSFEMMALMEPNYHTIFMYARKAWTDALDADYYYAFEKDWGGSESDPDDAHL